MTEIRVVIADDDPMVCSYLERVLGEAPDVSVVGTATDGAEAVDVTIRADADVVLMDIRMPDVSGIDATAELVRSASTAAVLLMTTVDSDQALVDGLRAGARGYTLKTAPVEMITDGIRAAARGADVLSPEATQRLLRLADRSPDPAPDEQLTGLPDREREVLRMIGAGATNAAIADSLFLAESTVKGHVSRLMTKLDCGNRTQLALLARQLG